MKFWVYIFILSICISCKKDNYRKVNADTIANNELKNINLKEVDRFPLFQACDETASRETQHKCFEQQLHQWFKPYLDTIKIDLTENDTVNLFLKVDKNGQILLDSLDSKVGINKTIRNIFKKAPKIYPAQKRGIPVSINLELPVILNVRPK